MLALILCQLSALTAIGQTWKTRYTTSHPLIIVGDWDKPPYEFLDREGHPSGINTELMKAVLDGMGVPYKYVLKDWSVALKMFERGDADIILANRNRYRNGSYAISENVIHADRICAVSLGDSARTLTYDDLLRDGLVLKTADYNTHFFKDLDSTHAGKVEFQSPKAALTGLKDGIYKYFLWGEEPLKWKIREYDLDGVVINAVPIPVSEVHIIGHDHSLVESMDDQYSRLKQQGDIQAINDKWLHPERIHDSRLPIFIFIILGIIVLAAIFYLMNRMARRYVKTVTNRSSELNNMMFKALHMGDFDVTEYDIRRDLMTNLYGNILPQEGCTLEQFIQQIHPSEQAEFRKKMDTLLSGRERKFELNKRWKTFDDDTTWLYFNGHAILELDSDGKPAYIINAIHDVTHNEEAEQANRKQTAKYKKLSNLPFFALSFYDKHGTLIDLNDQMRKMCGIIDNPENQRYWDSVNMFDIPQIRYAYPYGSTHSFQNCTHMEHPELGMNIYTEYEIRPLFNEQGELVYYFCSTVDVTSVRQHYVKMQQMVNLRQHLEQHIQMQKVWLDYLLSNSDRYLMYHDSPSKKLAFYRTPDDPEYVHDVDAFCSRFLIEPERETFLSLLTDSHSYDHQTYTIHLTRPSSRMHGTTFVESFAPVIDSFGNIIGHEGISRDVSALYDARKRLEEVTEQAKDSVKLKSAFLASMTHELRTPLNAVIGFSSVLEAMGACEERSEYVRIIRNSTDMLQRLINDIIEATSITQGPTVIELKEVDLAMVFDDIFLTLQQRVQGSHISIIKDSPYASYITYIDTGRIQQVLTNFVTNAVKFTRKGHIRLGYRYQKEVMGQEREGLYFYCEDTGIGIPIDKQHAIFERFVKLDEFVQGTGMGLNICRSIVERLNGQIGVLSKGPGHGSTFWFWIPVVSGSGTLRDPSRPNPLPDHPRGEGSAAVA